VAPQEFLFRTPRVTRYDPPATEAAHAGVDRVSAVGDVCGLRNAIDGKQQDSLGAKLHGDELHDGVQRAGGDLPNRLSRSLRSTLAESKWWRDVEQCQPAAERDGKYDLLIGLHHQPAHVPNELRSFISIPVIDWPAPPGRS
jgi:hypothetical protein